MKMMSKCENLTLDWLQTLILRVHRFQSTVVIELWSQISQITYQLVRLCQIFFLLKIINLVNFAKLALGQISDCNCYKLCDEITYPFQSYHTLRKMYLSMLGLKIIHVSKRGPWLYELSWKSNAFKGPLARYVKLRNAHAPGMPGTFSPPPQVRDPDMHHDTTRASRTCRDACRDR